jgi:nicotinamide riboside kinase
MTRSGGHWSPEAVSPATALRPTVAKVVALLGAESTGKTTLAKDLCAQLQRRGLRVTVVTEYLREFCDGHARTPTQNEQLGIAQEQTRRIAQAAAEHDCVIADTTAVMTALYSEWVFGDNSLWTIAWDAHKHTALTLLTGLDLPWVPDGIQRDSPQAQQGIDRLLRARLAAAGVPFSIVSGQGELRLQSALRAWDFQSDAREQGWECKPTHSARTAWRHICQTCDDPDCERQHWLAGHNGALTD